MPMTSGYQGLNTTREYSQWDGYQQPGFTSYRAQNFSGAPVYNQNNSILQTSMRQPPYARDTFGGPTNTSMVQGGQDWGRVQALVSDGDLNEAYSQVLMRSKDEMLLIKLMGKTGVCTSQLSKSVLDYLVSKIVELISKRDFLNVIMVWV